MGITFTEEAQEQWNLLTEEEKLAWTTNVSCQKCFAPIDNKHFNGSMYEGQIALFHLCGQCGNKEVRLIDVQQKTQKEIDDDFDRWLKAKREQHPDAFKK